MDTKIILNWLDATACLNSCIQCCLVIFLLLTSHCIDIFFFISLYPRFLFEGHYICGNQVSEHYHSPQCYDIPYFNLKLLVFINGKVERNSYFTILFLYCELLLFQISSKSEFIFFSSLASKVSNKKNLPSHLQIS